MAVDELRPGQWLPRFVQDEPGHLDACPHVDARIAYWKWLGCSFVANASSASRAASACFGRTTLSSTSRTVTFPGTSSAPWRWLWQRRALLKQDVRMTLWLTDDEAANKLLTRDPLALLLAMLLDQQGA